MKVEYHRCCWGCRNSWMSQQTSREATRNHSRVYLRLFILFPRGILTGLMCWAFSTLPGWLIAIFNSNVEDDERAEKKPVKIFMPNHRRLPKCSLLLSLDHRPAVCTRRIFRHRQMYKDERKKEIFVLYKFSLLYWLFLLYYVCRLKPSL